MKFSNLSQDFVVELVSPHVLSTQKFRREKFQTMGLVTYYNYLKKKSVSQRGALSKLIWNIFGVQQNATDSAKVHSTYLSLIRPRNLSQHLMIHQA